MNAANPPDQILDVIPAVSGQNLTLFDFYPAKEPETWKLIFTAIPALADEFSVEWEWAMLSEAGLKGKVGSVILESRYVCKDHRNLHSNYFSKRFSETNPNCCRLHFFTSRLNSTETTTTSQVLQLLADDKYRDSYIGYAVIRPDGRRVIGRTILNPALLGKGMKENYYCLAADYKVHLAGTTLTARGYPYISQDSESMVCAHAAIWGACRYLSQRYQVYRELYPYDIIIYTNPQRGRVVPYRGMTYNDYSDILTRFGCHPVLLDIEIPPKPASPAAPAMAEPLPKPDPLARPVSDVFRQIYAYIESGFPILASNQNHVLTLIGHTLPEKRVAPQPNSEGYIYSSQFVDALVAMDDNRFPYEKMTWAPLPGPLADKTGAAPAPDRPVYLDDLKHFVVPLPEKVFLEAKHAEHRLKIYIEKASIVSDEMQARLDEVRRSPGGLVIRQFVTTGSALKQEALRRYNETQSGIFTEIIDRPLPHFVWVMELATADGYAAGKCIGEVVIDATASAFLLNSLLFMRVDHFAYFNGASNSIIDKKPFEPRDQFSHNLGSINDMKRKSA